VLVIWNRTDDERVVLRQARAESLREHALDGREAELPGPSAEVPIDLARGVPRIFELR
jgi:hypothetical protein